MTQTQNHDTLAAWQAWRSQRASDLNTQFGWLSLTNLVWLSETPAEVPGLPGTWWLDGDAIVVTVPASLTSPATLTVHGQPDAQPDTQAPQTFRTIIPEGTSSTGAETAGGAQIEFLSRSGRRGLRVRAPHNRPLGSDGLVPAAPYDPQWVKPVTVTWFEQPRTVAIGTAQPGLHAEAVLTGTITFDHEGTRHELYGTGPRDAAVVTFADASPQTARWRYLPLNLVQDDHGNHLLDFNFAANYPSAFSPFGTCPAPADGNTLSVAVTAGELQPKQETS